MNHVIIYMMVTHFIADFLLQTRKMGQLKSSKPLWLLAHISIIFICFIPFGFKFAMSNALIHAIIDALLWNVYKVLVYLKHPGITKDNFKYWLDPWFYHTIGFDQLLHYLTLYILWSYL